MKVSKVVIPVAGWGTRSLPASKNIPKEMLPLYNKPVIQYVVEEAVRGGIRDVVFVTSRGKSVIEDHFDYNPQLEATLERGGKTRLLGLARGVAEMVNIMSARQKLQLGLGHAVLCARAFAGSEPFAVMVGDDLIIGEDAGLPQLIKIAEQEKKSVVGVMEVPADKVNRYGIVAGREIKPGLYDITDMVEKPDADKAPSRLAIVGRYVLTPGIFDLLEKAEPGHGGEIQLTDAMFALCKKEGMLAVKMAGMRFDAGDWVDYLAANVYFGLKDDNLRADLSARLRGLLDGG